MAEPSPEAATWRREGSGAVKVPGAEGHASDGAKTALPSGRRGVRAALESGRLGASGPQRPHDRTGFETGLTEGTRGAGIDSCLQECCPLAVSQIPGSRLLKTPSLKTAGIYLGESFFLIKLILTLFNLLFS